MSYSQIKVFGPSGDVERVHEFRNSHYITAIWGTLGGRYLGNANAWMFDSQGIWGLATDDRVSDDDWYVLKFTFDRCVVRPELFERLAEAFERFEVDPQKIDHGKGFAEAFRQAIAEEARGVALYPTSCGEDLWRVGVPCPECGCECESERRNYHLDKDDDHWWLAERSSCSD
jgi:hypothetical protein